MTIIAKPNIIPNLKTPTSLCQAKGENMINVTNPNMFIDMSSFPERDV